MDSIRIEDFTPQIIARDASEEYATMLVRVERCTICDRQMIHDLTTSFGNPFPAYYRAGFNAQRERAGWATRTADGVCVDCRAANKVMFTCALCGQRRPSSEEMEHFGEPADYLCKACYATVPAQQWHAKVDALEYEHRYDFE